MAGAIQILALAIILEMITRPYMTKIKCNFFQKSSKCQSWVNCSLAPFSVFLAVCDAYARHLISIWQFPTMEVV